MDSVSVKKRKCRNSSPSLQQEHFKGGESLNLPVKSRRMWHSDELKVTSRPHKARNNGKGTMATKF